MHLGTVSKLVGLLALHTAEAAFQIVPGATWTATNTGRHIQAHGSGIIHVGQTYYMMGEDKTNGSPFQNINCYSSSDLIHWKFENALLSQTSSGDLGPNRVVERPKIIYNDQTRDYVMYMHIDDSNYAEAKVGVATSKSVCGDYAYRGSFQPLGHQSRDMGLFKDDDGTAYLLTEDRQSGLRIDLLSSDYLQVTEPVYLWNQSIEAPAILKRDGIYFMFGSHLTGWATNDNVYSYASSMAGPWSPWATFADVGSNTYDSQTNFILPVGDWAIYMGDRWHSENLMRSTYVWLPLNITGTTVRMANHESWSVDLQSKTWKDGPKTVPMEGANAALTNGAVVVDCPVCANGKAAGYIGGPSDGTVTFPEFTLNKTCGYINATFVFTYVNRDATQRESLVQVNGEKQTVAFVPTGNDATVGQSVAHYRLKGGQSNVLVVSGVNGTYGADTEAVFVPYLA